MSTTLRSTPSATSKGASRHGRRPAGSTGSSGSSGLNRLVGPVAVVIVLAVTVFFGPELADHFVDLLTR